MKGQKWQEDEDDVHSYWVTLRKKRGYWKLKGEAPGHTLWRTHFSKRLQNCNKPHYRVNEQ